MDTTKEDRRIRRTKKLLKHALAELMQEKDFKNITVKEITDRADLNRGTFYLHYTDTYDLLEKIENEILENIQLMIDQNFEELDISDSLSPVLFPIAEYIEENADLCRSLLNNYASHDFTTKFQDLIQKNGVQFVKQQYPGNQQTNDTFFLSFISSGIVGLIRQWLNEPKFSRQELVVMADKVITGAANKLLTK